MLWKILFTLAVVVGTLWLKTRQSKQTASQNYQAPPTPSKWQKWSPLVLGALVVVAGLWGFERYQHGQQLLEVKVYQGERIMTYQVHRKDMEGRRFTTVDGLQVRLGDSDRVEVAESAEP